MSWALCALGGRHRRPKSATVACRAQEPRSWMPASESTAGLDGCGRCDVDRGRELWWSPIELTWPLSATRTRLHVTAILICLSPSPNFCSDINCCIVRFISHSALTRIIANSVQSALLALTTTMARAHYLIYTGMFEFISMFTSNLTVYSFRNTMKNLETSRKTLITNVRENS